MQAPMQPSSLPRGLQVPSSFGARRSISHDLARFSLDLAPERRRAHNRVPYPSPPMSHSPPPPLNPSSPSDPTRHQTAYYGSNLGQIQSSYGSYRYPHDQQQPLLFGANVSPGELKTFPAPFLQTSNNIVRFPPPTISAPGRPPFVSHTSFPPPPPPRRPKSHVASACVNCKKAHLACDTRRPCPRCVGLGKQDTCVDVQHKKRGRPRLRDDHRSHSFEIGQMSRPGILTSPSSPSLPISYRSSTHRVLKSQVESPRVSRRPSLTPREDIIGHHGNGTGYFDQRPTPRSSRIDLPPISNAAAYLTIDLLVAKSTEAIRELLGYTASELDCRKSLFDIVLETDFGKVEQLSSRIRAEVCGREPKNWLSEPQLCATIPAVDENQVPSAISGATTHTEMLHLRRPDGQYLRIRIRAHLAFASVYFVVVVFSLANEMPPPLQLNNNNQTSYANAPRLNAPTTGSGSTSSHQSPSFMTTSHHLHTQGGPSGPQSPFSYSGLPSSSPMESRPRTMHHESAYSLPQYLNPSHSPASSTFHRPPISPVNITPTTLSFGSASQTPILQQSDLQLPPLQLKSLPPYSGITGRMQSAVVTPEELSRIETPKRERIGVREMLE